MFSIDNPYFSAGFGLLGIGTGMAVMRRGLISVGSLVQRRFVSTLELTSRDPLFPHIMVLMSRAKKTAWNGHHYQLAQSCILQPGQGSHYVKFLGNILRVDRARERSSLDVGNNVDILTLSWIGDKNLPSLLVREAQSLSRETERGKLVVYTHFANEWRQFGHARRRRPLESVLLKDRLRETIVQDIERFLTNSAWYY
jgi:chaperone BCS1